MATTTPPNHREWQARPAVFILPLIVLALGGWGLKLALQPQSRDTDTRRSTASIVPVLAKFRGFVNR